MGRKNTVAFVLSTDSILSDLNAIDQWHLWKLLNGRGSYHSSVLKEVKLPKDIISSLNWILATEPWARIPEEWWRSLWASHNGNAWVDAICSSGVGKQKDIWGRGDFLQIWYNGKDLKVIHHARDIHHTQQQPKATRCHVPPAACQASWHQHFCPSCSCMGGGQRIPLPAPAPSFANAGFIISHPNRGLGHIHPVTGGDNQSWAGLPMPPDVAEAYRLGLHQHPVPRGSKQCGPGEDTQPLGGSHAGSCSETPRWGRRFHPLLFVFLTGLTFKSLSWNIKFRLG